MDKTRNEIALLAAEWWADKISTPKFDNGDNSGTGGLTMMMAHMLVKPVDEGMRTKFIDSLVTKIMNGLTDRYDMILGVDYGPDGTLHDAADDAGINANNFPWKTTMWIGSNHVSVRYGYRADTEHLYTNKAFWAKQIESARSTIEAYKNGEYFSWIKDESERKRETEDGLRLMETTIKEYELELNKLEPVNA